MDELENIQSKIYVIRGQRVMFDFDLAEIYDVKTKALNQSVKRNYKRIEGEEFMFLLTKEEWRIFTKQDTLLSEVSSEDPSPSDAYNLRSQIVTSRFSDNWGGNRRSQSLRSQNVTLKLRKPIGFIQPKDDEEKEEEKKD